MSRFTRETMLHASFLMAVILTTAGGTEAAETKGFSIPLRISSHPAVTAPEGWPTTTGVPFENGQLQEAQLKDLRVIGPGGQALPAQFEVRGRYPSTKAVRWLGVTWLLVPEAKEYRLVLEAQPSKQPVVAPKPTHPVTVEEADGAVRITTGRLKALIKPGQGLLAEVWLSDKLLLKHGEGHGDWLTTLSPPQGGAAVRHVGQVETVKVERRGPVQATVHVKGKYVNPKGRPPCEFQARLHFYAGRPEVWITHQFIWLGHSEELQIADLAITFGLGQKAEEASVDRSAELGDQPYKAPLAQGGMLSVLQDELYHWGHGKSHYGIRTGSPEKPTEKLSGEQAGSWISARAKEGAVTLALRNLWQMYPKELRAEPDRLTVFLWATHGKALPFDLREANLKALWGPVAMASIKNLPEYKNTFDDHEVMDATGLARTHELLLRFENPAEAGDRDANARAVLECFEHYPVASPDPAWVEQSGVLQYKFSAPNPRRPELDRWRNGLFDQIRRHQEKWGDYGFLYFGQGPHMGNFRPELPADQEKMSMLMYGQTYPTPYWFGFLQSGERLHFLQARNHSQFYLDTKLLHASAPFKRKGDFNWYGRRGTIPWSGTPKKWLPGPVPAVWPDRGHYVSLEFGLMSYYMTGDDFSRDALKSTAQLFKDYTASLPRWPEDLLKNENAVSTQWKVIALKVGDLAMFYEMTEDAYFLDHASRLLKGLIDPAQPTRLRATKDPGLATVDLDFGQRNLLRYLRVAEDAGLEEEARLTRTGLLGMAEYKRRVEFSVRASGPLMAFAWAQTKNPVYLRLGLDDLSSQVSDERLESGVHINSHTGADALRNIAALTIPLSEAGPLPVRYPLHVKYDREQKATTLLLGKEKGKALGVEFTAHSQTLSTPDGKPWNEAWMGKPTVFHLSPFSFMHAVKRPVQYFKGAIPADAPAGDYRIAVPADGFISLLSTNAVRFEIEGSKRRESK